MTELNKEMKTWVNMLDALLDGQKSTKPSIANIPVEQLKQRDNTEAASQMSLGSRLQQMNDNQLQTLVNQYPQISETFKPVEELISNYTKMQAAYYGNSQQSEQNIWSNNQYQTNPVYPYQQEKYETNNYWNKDATNNNNNNNYNNNNMENKNFYQYATTATKSENNLLNQYFMPGKESNNNDNRLLSSNLPTSPSKSNLPTVQSYVPASPAIVHTESPMTQTNPYFQTYQGSENIFNPTEKKIRPWPTPRPFRYNLDLLKVYQERVLEKQLQEEELRKQKPTAGNLVNMPTKSWKAGNAAVGGGYTSQLNALKEKHMPAIRIAQFSGNQQQKDARVHPWPFALKIKVIPPDGGNYIMRIKGPMDALSGSHPKFDMGQGRSMPLNNEMQSNKIGSQRKYIPPVNKNYKFPTNSFQNQNPIVYLKVPRSHQNFIELTTSFPSTDDKNLGNIQSKNKIVSLKLPFNVSLATVLRNIYENMFVNYLNKKPSEIFDEKGQSTPQQFITVTQRKESERLIPEINMNNMRSNPVMNSFENGGTHYLTRMRGPIFVSNVRNVKKKETPFKNVEAFSKDVSSFNKGMQLVKKGENNVKSTPFMPQQRRSKNMPSSNISANQRRLTGNEAASKEGMQQVQLQNSKYKQFKAIDWKNIYQKLKQKFFKKATQQVPQVPMNPSKFVNSKIEKSLKEKNSEAFPESIKLRLYPHANLNLNQLTQNLASLRKNSAKTPGKNVNVGNLKTKYYAELILKKPIQKINFDKKTLQISRPVLGNNLQRSNEITARMLPFQREVRPVNLQTKQMIQQQKQQQLQQQRQQLQQQQQHLQNHYQLSQPLIRQSVASRQPNTRPVTSMKNVNRFTANQNIKNQYQMRPKMITFHQMEIPYKYLVNPVRLGSRWRLVPVSTHGEENQSNQANEPSLKREQAINVKDTPKQKIANMRQNLPSLIEGQRERQQRPRQIYGNQVQILRQLQRDANMGNTMNNVILRNRLLGDQKRIIEQKQINLQRDDEVTELSATVLPIKMAVKKPLLKQGKLGSPLMDRLTHGLPILKKIDANKGNIFNQEGTTQKKDGKQTINQEQIQSNVKDRPIVVTEMAQTRNFNSPATITNKEEKESSNILSQFLEETAPRSQNGMNGVDWDKRKSIPKELFDSDIVSRSTLPELPNIPLSDHEIIKAREHHLKNRLVRLKRKRLENFDHDVKKTALQRTKRL